MYTSAWLTSVTNVPFSRSNPGAQGGNVVGGCIGSMVLMMTGLQPLSSSAFELVAQTQAWGGIVNTCLYFPRKPSSSRDSRLTVMVSEASNQPPVPIGTRFCVQAAASPYTCSTRSVGSEQAMVFSPVRSIDSWVSVSWPVFQRASIVSEVQARTATLNSTGKGELTGELPLSFSAATRTSTASAPISSVAVVSVVVLTCARSTYSAYDFAPGTASQVNSPIDDDWRVNFNAAGAVGTPTAEQLASSAAQMPDGQQKLLAAQGHGWFATPTSSTQPAAARNSVTDASATRFKRMTV